MQKFAESYVDEDDSERQQKMDALCDSIRGMTGNYILQSRDTLVANGNLKQLFGVELDPCVGSLLASLKDAMNSTGSLSSLHLDSHPFPQNPKKKETKVICHFRVVLVHSIVLAKFES